MPRQELPEIDVRLCTLCGDCLRICPTDCLRLVRESEIVIAPEACISCAVCEAICPDRAIAMLAGDW